MAHKVYKAIVTAVKNGKLKEPFTSKDFKNACSGFGNGTYKAFLHKHSVGNPDSETELFKRVKPGRFKCVKPYKYGA